MALIVRTGCLLNQRLYVCSYKEWDFFIVFFVIQQFLSSCTSVYFPANCLFTNAFAKITLTGLKVY
jgi:hypothetical protein